jgi:hypothetical protein
MFAVPIAFFTGLGLLVSIELFAWFVLCTLFVSFEKGWFAFWGTLAFIAALTFSGFNIFTWLKINYMLVPEMLAIYLLIGIAWACLKFIIKCRKARKLYLTDKDNYLTATPHPNDKNPRTLDTWMGYVSDGYGGTEKYNPTVNANKSNLGFWTWWWPFSMVSFFFEDFFKKIVDTVWAMTKGLFGQIRNAALGEALELENYGNEKVLNKHKSNQNRH